MRGGCVNFWFWHVNDLLSLYFCICKIKYIFLCITSILTLKTSRCPFLRFNSRAASDVCVTWAECVDVQHGSDEALMKRWTEQVEAHGDSEIQLIRVWTYTKCMSQGPKQSESLQAAGSRRIRPKNTVCSLNDERMNPQRKSRVCQHRRHTSNYTPAFLCDK